MNRDNVIDGAQLAFGQPVETQYKLGERGCDRLTGCGFSVCGISWLGRYTRDFAKRRNPDAGNMSRLYVVESTPSSTGAKADHRLPVRAVEIEPFARALAASWGLVPASGTLNAGAAKFLDRCR